MVTFGRNLVQAPKTLVQAQARKSCDSGKNCSLCPIHSLFHQPTIISNSTRLHSQRSGWHHLEQNSSQQKVGKKRSLWKIVSTNRRLVWRFLPVLVLVVFSTRSPTTTSPYPMRSGQILGGCPKRKCLRCHCNRIQTDWSFQACWSYNEMDN